MIGLNRDAGRGSGGDYQLTAPGVKVLGGLLRGATDSVVMELTARKCKWYGEVNKAKDVMEET